MYELLLLLSLVVIGVYYLITYISVYSCTCLHRRLRVLRQRDAVRDAHHAVVQEHADASQQGVRVGARQVPLSEVKGQRRIRHNGHPGVGLKHARKSSADRPQHVRAQI